MQLWNIWEWRNVINGVIATVASCHSTALKFCEILRKTHSFTNDCERQTTRLGAWFDTCGNGTKRCGPILVFIVYLDTQVIGLTWRVFLFFFFVEVVSLTNSPIHTRAFLLVLSPSLLFKHSYGNCSIVPNIFIFLHYLYFLTENINSRWRWGFLTKVYNHFLYLWCIYIQKGIPASC